MPYRIKSFHIERISGFADNGVRLVRLAIFFDRPSDGRDAGVTMEVPVAGGDRMTVDAFEAAAVDEAFMILKAAASLTPEELYSARAASEAAVSG